MLGFALTPPLAVALGGWRPALAVWAVLSGLALAAWHLAPRDDEDRGPVGGTARQPGRSLLRSPLAWIVTEGWTVPFIMLIGVLLVQMVAGALAGRPRYV